MTTISPELSGVHISTQATKCWRITGIPDTWDKDTLLDALQKIESLENLRRCVEQLSLHSEPDGSTKAALLNLNEQPGFFKGIDRFTPKFVSLGGGGSEGNDLCLWVDCNFYGFTPLNTPEGDVLADVIAVSGLGGHAFGSWKDKGTGRMWLMDFLPFDIKGIRVMLYGYDTNLERPTGGLSVLDHSRIFMDGILHVRSLENATNRPIIFIGHSFGGLLVLKTLARASRGNQMERHVFDSTHALILFGTPHEGFDVSQLEQMVKEKKVGDAMLNLLQYLKPESDFMAVHKDEMAHLLPRIPKIISFYEKRDTPRLKRLRTGEYKRAGEAEKMVNEISALLNLPNEHRIPVQLNHSMMVKFANNRDSPYHSVIGNLRQVLKDIPHVISTKLQQFEYNQLNNNRNAYAHPSHPYQPPTPQNIPTIYQIPFELGHQWLQNLRFTGRKNLLETLTTTLATKNPPERQATVIYGTGGVGKTEIALQYIYKNNSSYTSVFWVNATSLATTNQSFGSILQRIVQHAVDQSTTSPDYLQIAQSLGMPKGLDSDGNLCADIETVNTAVKRWFCKQENTGWLMVFDNVDDLESFKISFFIPTCAHGTVIMTSRRPECVDLGAGLGILVEEMEEADGIELLLKCTKINLPTSSEDPMVVAEIAKKLGYLPLAIYQAGAYICAQKLSLRRYLERFETHFDKLFGKKPPNRHVWRYRDDTVFTTWEISFRAIEEENKDAARLFLLCSFLSNNDIWYDMLRYGLEDSMDEETFDGCRQILFSYSLASQKGLDECFYIHPLIHRWARKRMSQEQLEEMADSALLLVCRALEFVGTRCYTDVGGNSELKFIKRNIAHIEIITIHTQDYLGAPHNGLGSKVVTHDFITSVSYLAYAHWIVARYKEAEELLLKALAGRERLLGADHVDTLTSMNNLAITYFNQGRLKEAEELDLKALAGRESLLGSDHVDTLRSMNNLATTYYKQGRLKEAEELHLKALAGRERLLGADHVDTLESINNLATTYSNQGRLKEAEELHLKALASRERLLGADHIDTLRSMNNLANTYSNQGRLKEGEELHLKALAGRESLLGADHVDTLESMNNLANTYSNQGRLKEAEELDLKALAGRERLLGADHVDTLRSMNNLATTYHKQGRLKEGEELYLKALAGRESLLGADHIDTLESMSNLAITYYKQGRLKEAEELHLKALAGRESLLGADHVDTLTSMNNLAITYRKQGRLKEAEDLKSVILSRESGEAH